MLQRELRLLGSSSKLRTNMSQEGYVWLALQGKGPLQNESYGHQARRTRSHSTTWCWHNKTPPRIRFETCRTTWVICRWHNETLSWYSCDVGWEAQTQSYSLRCHVKVYREHKNTWSNFGHWYRYSSRFQLILGSFHSDTSFWNFRRDFRS
jgi:hypothetical protein